MKTAHINYTGTGMGMDYETAKSMAAMFAEKDPDIIDPVVVAWYDHKSSRMSPVLEGCAIETSWHDYGESHSGKLEIDVNGEFDFIFADSSPFETYGPTRPSPYVNMHDQTGKEYVCLISALHRPHDPHLSSKDACVLLDEWTSKLT